MEYSCETCIGACCTRMMRLPLNLTEVEFLEGTGTKLIPMLEAEHGISWRDRFRAKTSANPVIQELIVVSKVLDEGQGYYQLMTDCGYRAPDGDWQRCLAFNDPDRPQICHEFPAESPGCHQVRLTRGLDYDEKVLFGISSATTQE